MKHRLVALDWMRGAVIVLMTIDHASSAFNAGRLVTDSATFYTPGTPLPIAQFGLRWMTHLCAPTFLFLAGAALALSLERRARAGAPARTIDRQLFVRGVLIAAIDPLLISRFWGRGVILQVLFAIGASMLCMIPLRRLSTRWLLGVALAFYAGAEILVDGALAMSGGEPSVVGAVLIHGGFFGSLMVLYPLLPWLAILMLGWVFGRWLLDAPSTPARSPARVLLAWGAGALAVFLVVRGLDGYGNMGLHRDDLSLAHWLHVSKYPPSLTFVTLELGVMALALAALFWLAGRVGDRVWSYAPLLVFGQTALFFYVLHIPLLELAASALDLEGALDISGTLAAAAVALAVLYPLCLGYRRYKAAHPESWARYL